MSLRLMSIIKGPLLLKTPFYYYSAFLFCFFFFFFFFFQNAQVIISLGFPNTPERQAGDNFIL